MMARRLLAALGAVALIAAALVVRAVVFDGGVGGNGNGKDAPAASRTAVCATELAAACQDAGFADVTVEAPGVTADRLAAGKRLGADVWVATTPWPAMVTSSRRDARLGEVGPPLASSSLLLVTTGDRFGALSGRCDPFGWRCLGDLVGTPWAELGVNGPTMAIGVDPADSTAGLLTVGGLVAGWFEGEGIAPTALATNDLELDDSFRDWLGRLAASSRVRSPGSGSVLERFVAAPAGGSTVTAFESDVSRVVVGAAVSRFAHAAPGPLVATQAVVVGGASDDVRTALRRALRDAGWAAPTADAATGLPNSGVMVALRDRWRQLTR